MILVQTRIDDELAEQLVARAEREGLKVAALVRVLLTRELRSGPVARVGIETLENVLQETAADHAYRIRELEKKVRELQMSSRAVTPIPRESAPEVKRPLPRPGCPHCRLIAELCGLCERDPLPTV